MSTESFPARPEDRTWFILDAQDYPLGRLASYAASLLRGKHKPTYSPHVDLGDHVVILNAAKVQLTGKKLQKKTYFRHTGYIGGARSRTLEEVMATRPEEAVRRAVRGMLPKNRLGRQMIRKLRIYADAKHPHEAQKPTPVTMTRFGPTPDGS
jgi:large subunit ribosomal protein L13